MNQNLRFAIGGLAIVGAVAYLMYVGVRETSVFYFEIDEFLAQREALADTGLRVAGRVAPGSIDYDPKTLELRFRIGEFEKTQTGPSVPVAFTGIKPDMFDDGRDVIVEGVYTAGVFQADKVLTSCPSKYEAELEEEGAA